MAIWRLKCFYEKFEQGSTLGILVNFGAKNPPHHQAENRCQQCYTTPQSRQFIKSSVYKYLTNNKMTDEQQFQQIAAQLRKPHGEDGLKTAEWMNKGNLHMHRDTISVLNAEAADNILEIGMGNGFYVNEILSKHRSINYTGCDYSELMIEESEKINAELISNGQAKFILSNVDSLPFTDDSFNKIFTINTIYFWDNEIKVLNEIKRVLQPNGKLVIGFRPEHYTVKYPFIKYGFKQFSKEDALKLLSDSGFADADAFENREPDFDMNGEVMKMENVVVVAIKK